MFVLLHDSQLNTVPDFNLSCSPKSIFSPFLTQISPFVLPNLTKTLGWVGGFTHLRKLSQTKTFFWGPSLKLAIPEYQADILCIFKSLKHPSPAPTDNVIKFYIQSGNHDDQVISNSECNAPYGGITSNMLCAADASGNGGSDACQVRILMIMIMMDQTE